MKEQIVKDLETIYKDKPHRLAHVFGVRDTAIKLGKKYNLDTSKLELAALLHDITKYYTNAQNVEIIKQHYTNSDEIISEYNHNILHAFSARVIAERDYQIKDIDVLDAITSHTVGRPQMSMYEQILFISDYVEPNRTYPSCVEARELVEDSLDKATFKSINDSIKHFEALNEQIPKTAYRAREYYKQQLEVQNEKN